MKLITFFGLSIMTVLASCTMEKRVYMSGYHIEWNKSKHSPDKQTTSNEIKKSAEKYTVTTEQRETVINEIGNSYERRIIDDNLTASANNPQIILPQKKQRDFLSSHKEEPTSKEKPSALSFKSGLKKNVEKVIIFEDGPKFESWGVASCIIGMLAWVLLFANLSLLVPALIMFFLSLVFGVVSLIKIYRNPGKYKGKGFAFTSIIMATMTFICLIYLIALVRS